MQGERRKFRREGEERRRDALIAAALDLIAEGGPEAATVRAIALRAGVTPGLIRHYFQSKEDLSRAAYADLMARMTEANAAVLEAAPADPAARLAAFVAASLAPPVMDGQALSLWAGFLQMTRRDPAMAAVHEAAYLAYRDLLQGLIAALPGAGCAKACRTRAIACNAVIDGLWLEGGALPHAFAPGELARIGLTAVGAIIGHPLPPPQFCPPPTPERDQT